MVTRPNNEPPAIGATSVTASPAHQAPSRAITVIDLPTFLSSAANSELRLRPLATMTGALAAAAVHRGDARNLAGSARAFGIVELLARTPSGIVTTAAPLPDLMHAVRGEPALRGKVEAALYRLEQPRPTWAGFTLDRTLIMGILNVTPDSFSDGGRFANPAHAVEHGHTLAEAGADIIDIGGESTRPGAPPVTPEDEIGRIGPVIEALAAAGMMISVDTRHPTVMARALAAGARIINDVTALSHPDSLALAARANAAVVLMHMQGEPRTMQAAPGYDLASLDIAEYLEARISASCRAGIRRDAIAVDPGIGFGKSREHNLEILARITLFHGLGTPVLIGASRKSFLGGPVDARLPGSLAIAVHAAQHGVQILRVHDVAETRAAVALTEALANAP